MHDMFSGRQAGVAIATGVGHKPGGDSIFDWLSRDRRDHGWDFKSPDSFRRSVKLISFCLDSSTCGCGGLKSFAFMRV